MKVSEDIKESFKWALIPNYAMLKYKRDFLWYIIYVSLMILFIVLIFSIISDFSLAQNESITYNTTIITTVEDNSEKSLYQRWEYWSWVFFILIDILLLIDILSKK
ncbi:MAG: hypothetical protein AABY22_16625 [Nanoarchaeota archaeon]